MPISGCVCSAATALMLSTRDKISVAIRTMCSPAGVTCVKCLPLRSKI
ncbi:Uncharacterised protein [Vibrio cholerae]|nr:Uncharacterised protein [Vibrio cholerae]CSI36005.1 Uncharacterised protein [Vibrio cholerae]